MTTTEITDIGKLQAQAAELRGAASQALADADDAKGRRLFNELAAVNKQILDAEAIGQLDARNDYMSTMSEALFAFEQLGFTFAVKFDAINDTLAVVYTPTDATITGIKAVIAKIDRPSSATKWSYDAENGFDFGRGARRPSSNGDGTRTVGWTGPNGDQIALGDAFDACATKEQVAELAKKSGGSATNAYKSKIVKDAGYSKN
jgi:hypothetical protein